MQRQGGEKKAKRRHRSQTIHNIASRSYHQNKRFNQLVTKHQNEGNRNAMRQFYFLRKKTRKALEMIDQNISSTSPFRRPLPTGYQHITTFHSQKISNKRLNKIHHPL
jgi:hypothetical protein